MGRGEDQRHAAPAQHEEEASEVEQGTAAERAEVPGGDSAADPGGSAAAPPGEPGKPDDPVASQATGAPDGPEVPEAGDEPAGHEAGGDAGAVGNGEPESLAAALEEAERTRDKYLDLLQRERAEFENFRRRANRERGEALDRGAESVVTSLLGVLDNFGFVLEAAEQSEDTQLAKGVSMVHDEFVRSLEAVGLEPVPGEGAPFDPNHHEAMMQVEAEEDVAEPTVVQVLRPGYRFKGRVLRPASVSVAQ